MSALIIRSADTSIGALIGTGSHPNSYYFQVTNPMTDSDSKYELQCQKYVISVRKSSKTKLLSAILTITVCITICITHRLWSPALFASSSTLASRPPNAVLSLSGDLFIINALTAGNQRSVRAVFWRSHRSFAALGLSPRVNWTVRSMDFFAPLLPKTYNYCHTLDQ